MIDYTALFRNCPEAVRILAVISLLCGAVYAAVRTSQDRITRKENDGDPVE